MDIQTSSSASVSFTDEEKEILQKAHDILRETAKELWSDGSDAAEDLSFEIGGVADGINGILGNK
jgi:hypothetical protein